MSQPLVLTEIDPAGFALVTLNRPDALNALSRALMGELAQTIDRLEADPAVRVLILTGAGKAFCAGLDLKELGSGRASVRSRRTARRRRERPCLSTPWRTAARQMGRHRRSTRRRRASRTRPPTRTTRRRAMSRRRSCAQTRVQRRSQTAIRRSERCRGAPPQRLW